MQDYQDRLAVATAEGVELSVVLAGVGSRILAKTLDIVLVWTPILIGAFVLALSLGNFGVALFFVLSFYALFGYDVMCERLFNGRTLGKRIMGLRVMRDGATRVDIISSAMRSVLTLIDFWMLTPLVAITSVLVTKHNKRLGDLAASTIVVREPKAPKNKGALAEPAVQSTPAAGGRQLAGSFGSAAGSTTSRTSSCSSPYPRLNRATTKLADAVEIGGK